MTDEEIEGMLDDLLEDLETHPSRYTAWEREFIENLSEMNDWHHLTEAQADKLYEVHLAHC